MKLITSCLVICLAYALTCLTRPVNGRPHPEYVLDESRSLDSESKSSSHSDDDSEDAGNEVEPCLPGWVMYSGSCYYFSQTEATWEDARAACSNYTSLNVGHLVDIHSQEEQDFLHSQMTSNVYNNFWIGLNDREIDGEYVWADTNRDVNFTFFHSNFRQSVLLDCVQIIYKADMVLSYPDGWHSGNCRYVTEQYICEMDAFYN